MLVGDGRPGIGGEERRAQDRVADVATAHLVLAGEAGEVERAGDRDGAAHHRAPEAGALVDVGQREVDVERQPAAERLVDRAVVVRGEDADAAEGLEPLEQVVGLLVGVAIVAGLDGGALAEQRVGLVEQQDRVACLRGVEQAREVLLGLADPLRDDLAHVDLVEVGGQLLGDEARGHRLARAGGAREQRRYAQPAADVRSEAPGLVDGLALRDAGEQLSDRVALVVREHERLPGLGGVDPRREPGELAIEHGAQADADVVRVDRP